MKTRQAQAERRGARGFTLIELMMVIGIGGIIAGLATPSLIGLLRRNSVSGAMRELYGGYLEAQGRTRGEGRVHCLVLNKTARSWSIQKDTDGDGACDATVRTTAPWPTYVAFGPAGGYPGALAAPYDVPHDSWCTPCGGADSGEIRFGSDGAVQYATAGSYDFLSGSVSLYDTTSSSGHAEALVIIGLTGDVRVYRSN